MAELRFDGKVVLVTGAGSGLGKAYALAFGARGAKVVVNDLGGDIKGGGKSSRPADLVVDEIKSKGGEAVANYDSVELGDKLIKTALDNFGRIDIVVNNAGILRDRSFARMSDDDWDIIQRVHLRGSFLVTRAAWEHMKKQKFGRIIMTASSSGLYGNFGQANYAAAKLGLVGLSHTLAKEGVKYNITCNTIAPMAGTRLLATVSPEEVQNALKPAYVAPFVLWLCHPDCSDTGSVFELGGGFGAQVRWQRSKGVLVRDRKDVPLTPEAVRNKWDEITNFDSEAEYPTSGAEGSGMVYQMVTQVDSQPGVVPNKTSAVNPDQAIGTQLPKKSYTYTDLDVILYALGVGVTTQQDNHLKYLFELHEDFCVLPTFIVTSSMSSMAAMATGGIKGLEIDPTKILHGEQYLELYKPLSTSGTVSAQAKMVDVLDKGRGALLIQNVETFNEKNEKVAFSQFVTYVQQAGGFGGKRSSPHQIMPVDAPKRAPDASVQQKTNVDQAALYRLHGDRNPLHIDPSFAAMGGFSTPILHGLCQFGFAVRHVLQTYADGDVTKFKAVKVRFSKPVLPGQTLQTDMWKEGNRIHFQCKVVETGDVTLTGAYVDLHSTTGPSQAQENSAAGSQELQSDTIFALIKERVKVSPEVVKKVNAILGICITQGGNLVRTWTLDMKGKGDVYQGDPKSGKSDLTITVAEDTFLDLASGKLNGQQAFMSGKIKAKGNIMMAQKLVPLLEQEKAKL